MGEKGLVGAFQQLIFESGNAGPKVISVFKAITLGAANAINVLAKAFFITSATFKLTTRDFVGAAKDFYKATQNFIDVGSVSKQFDSVAKGIDNYAVRGIPSAIRAQQGLKGSVEELTGDDTSGLKGATKAIVTAEQKLKSYGDSLKKSTSLQLRFSDAQKSEKKSLATLTDANNDLASAKAKLAQIERGFGVGSPEALAAQAELAKAQRSQERAVYAVEEAVFSVADAEKNLAEIRKDPESSAMDIRRAEINLAEAKLSVADATDSQAESTKELNDQQRLLNDAIFGATVGSILYDQALRDVEDATRQQVSAYEAWEEAVTNTKNAQDDFNASLQATADLIRKYPKVLGGMPNPMANLVPDSTLANNAGSLFNGGGMGNVNIEVNAGLGASGIEVGQEIEQYLKEYLNFTGGQFSFGSIGSIF
jgi:chromosome segregation ATPase